MNGRCAAGLVSLSFVVIAAIGAGREISADQPSGTIAIMDSANETVATTFATAATSTPGTRHQYPHSAMKLGRWEPPLDGHTDGTGHLSDVGAIIVATSEEECREYESTGTVAGQTKRFRGIACRQRDGQWQIKNLQEIEAPPIGQTQDAHKRSYNCSTPDKQVRRDVSRGECDALGGYAWRSQQPGAAGYGAPATTWGWQGQGGASISGDDLFQYPVAPGEQRLVHAGYGRFFQPIRELIAKGRFDDAQASYDDLTKKIKTVSECNPGIETCETMDPSLSSDGAAPGTFLSALEKGALALDSGKISEGIEKLTMAEAEITERKKKSGPLAFLEEGATFLAETLLGVEELGDYKGEGFERVLILNYTTIAYLLRGDRKAYNVTRRAIDWQNLEKRRFEDELRKAKEKLKKLQEEQQQQGRDVSGLGINQALSERYAQNAQKADKVPSAYVNPFGYYVAGMVQEFESYADPSLRDNARISYEKALELNPSSDALKQAIRELKGQAPPRGNKLVHVVVAEGLAPLKKTMVFGMQFGNMIFPVKVPIYETVPSPIQSLEARTPDGTSLGMLSPLADIEAIALRHERDSEPFRNLRVSLAVVRTVFEKHLFQQLGGLGDLLGRARDAMTTPDMRSWLSLPARIHVGRFHVPKTVNAIRLVARDEAGHPKATKDIELGPTHGFVYVRCVEDNLAAYTNKTLWLAKF